MDYLLKPVEQARLQAAVDRARARLRVAAAERAQHGVGSGERPSTR